MNESFWKDYRKATGKLTWRLATSDDLSALRRLQKISERFLGAPQKNPCFFAAPVLLTLVAEDSSGKIVDALYVEAQVELVKLACTERGFRESAELEEDLSHWLRSIGFKTVLVTTSEKVRDRMKSLLSKLRFRPMDGVLSYWRRWL